MPYGSTDSIIRSRNRARGLTRARRGHRFPAAGRSRVPSPASRCPAPRRVPAWRRSSTTARSQPESESHATPKKRSEAMKVSRRAPRARVRAYQVDREPYLKLSIPSTTLSVPRRAPPRCPLSSLPQRAPSPSPYRVKDGNRVARAASPRRSHYQYCHSCYLSERRGLPIEDRRLPYCSRLITSPSPGGRSRPLPFVIGDTAARIGDRLIDRDAHATAVTMPARTAGPVMARQSASLRHRRLGSAARPSCVGDVSASRYATAMVSVPSRPRSHRPPSISQRRAR